MTANQMHQNTIRQRNQINVPMAEHETKYMQSLRGNPPHVEDNIPTPGICAVPLRHIGQEYQYAVAN
jgi:hypothetical protein|eukprot:CAMPEP_0174363272 /NCGR_PEP_ID=MMETSP0811_2-20130205/68166_1 /TAXON_ID=73025 ORGANISM="Eutreptiella gymnastica-like, Strain CCMP1594" /NCGR_SAMPLE_ID=MMETSP0811_2 /ASSEMBLY_ACC=CAM_ASM_000667 /LENGTH=66 /DNA_ID=CAMNT_0015501839 /DNA_START=274 /DNA_END=474 /DNA_ORIENTATION=-